PPPPPLAAPRGRLRRGLHRTCDPPAVPVPVTVPGGPLLDRVLGDQALADRPPVEAVDGGDLPVPGRAGYVRAVGVVAPPGLGGGAVLAGRIAPARLPAVEPEEVEPAGQVVGDCPLGVLRTR